jgi:plastocyanin
VIREGVASDALAIRRGATRVKPVVTFRLALVAAAAALFLPGTATAQNPRLLGSVGPGFTITLTDASGNPVTRLNPGTYEIVVTDRSDLHNFHLDGPGVDMRTAVDFVGTVTWTVTLVPGVYNYVCDPHSSDMRGSFAAGDVPLPAPAPAPAPTPAPTPVPQRGAQPGRLNGSVGPGFTISLRTAAGRLVRTIRAGLYTLVVRDRSRMHNFHLSGPGVNRRTGVPFSGAVTWNVRFRAGATYRFVCDPHARSMRGSFRITR